MYIYPDLREPTFIRDRSAPAYTGEITLHFIRDDKFAALAKTFPVPSTVELTGGRIDIGIFGRMLAKVAHAFASAELGVGNFKPTLLDIIDGVELNPFKWVGGFEPPRPQHTHGLVLDIVSLHGSRYAVVSISLGSLPEMPRFQVVAGELFQSTPFPWLSKDGRDALEALKRDDRAARARAAGTYGQHKTSRRKGR